jgi:hypothetical protein
MQESRTLLISDICPGAELTAGIALEKFIVRFKKSVYTFTICNPKFHTMLLSKVVPPTNSYWATKPNENWEITNRFFAFFGDLIATLETTLLHKRIKDVIENENINHVLIVLQGQTMYRVFNLLKENDLTITTLTWDSWEWSSFANKVPKRTDRQVERIQKKFTTKGFHLVPTERMAHNLNLNDHSFQRFVMPSNEIDLLPKTNLYLKTRVLKIVFSGQSYALNETLRFIDILERLNWKILDFKLELHIIGNNSIPTGRNIFQHGWLDQNRLIETLNEMNLAFLPYPLDGLPESIASESFPSKLSDYSYAGLPVIYIGPQNSEIVRSLDRFGVHLKTSYTLDQVYNLLSSLVTNLSTFGENSKLFYQEVCSDDVFNMFFLKAFPNNELQCAQEKDGTSNAQSRYLNSTLDLSLRLYMSHLFSNILRLISSNRNNLFVKWFRRKVISLTRYFLTKFARLRLTLVLPIEKQKVKIKSL